MKKIILLLFAAAAMALFATEKGWAQSTCNSSFKCDSPSTRVILDTANGHHFSELYDTSAFTWEAWINLSDTETDQRVLISVEDHPSFQDIWLGTGWNSTNGAMLYFVIYKNAGSAHVDIVGSKHLLVKHWYYVTAVCDYVHSVMNLYIDGINVGSAAIPSTFTASDRLVRDITTGIGNFNSVNGFSAHALIDEVKFWKGVRTPTQILSDSAGCMSLPQPGLVAYFKANEGVDTFTSSFVDTNFTGKNTAEWGTQVPINVCEPRATITASGVPYCPPGSAKLKVHMTGLAGGQHWSVKLSDSSVISGIADSTGTATDSETVSPYFTTIYSIVRLTGKPCDTLKDTATVVVKNCCSPTIIIPATACTGQTTAMSVSDICKCIDTSAVQWKIQTPSGSTVTFAGATSSYNFPSSGTYIVCVSWSDNCRMKTLSHCDTVTVKYCPCNPIISVPSDACTGDNVEFSIADDCNCIDARRTTWTVSDASHTLITTLFGTTTSYSFTSSGTYYVCVTWSDKCKAKSFTRCYTVVVTNCCVCDMRIDEYASTTDYVHNEILGSIHLRSGSKKVVAVEMSIPYFNYKLDDTCSFDCKKLNIGYPLGNFTNADDINGTTYTFPGCIDPDKRFAREVDWSFSTPTNIDQNIRYNISIPPSYPCQVNYDYCVKVLIRYDDCTSCECIFCIHDEKYSCGCDASAGKSKSISTGDNSSRTAQGLGTIKIYPNPNGGQFTITMDKTTDDKVITIVDMGGKIVSKSIVNRDISSFEMTNVAAGIYNVVISADGATVTKRVVVTK